MNSFMRLQFYCENENFKGYDPYDGLNSSIFLFIKNIKKTFFNIYWIQFFKRCPINFRKIFFIKKSYNPKSFALFLSGYCNLYKNNPQDVSFKKINYFIDKIIKTQINGYSGACWGYNFDWSSRAFFLKKNTPTIVVSSFIANALLDAYEITNDKNILNIARSTCDFIIIDLHRTYDDNNNLCFSYSPNDNTVVYNASLLGAALLARLYHYTQERELYILSKSAFAFCCNVQNDNGSWKYGFLKHHNWIDNFHTGYILTCLANYEKYTLDNQFNPNLKKGFDFYINTFFTIQGESKYYDNSLYPIDTHSVAQLLVTLQSINNFKQYQLKVQKILEWTIKNMQSKKGFFYYQIHKYYKIKIPYMRWTQAWMFYGLTTYINYNKLNFNNRV